MKRLFFRLMMIVAMTCGGWQVFAQCDAPSGYTATAIDGQCWLDHNTPAADALWTRAQLNGTPNPCPAGWRLPTLEEFAAAAPHLGLTASNDHKLFFWTLENIQNPANDTILYFEDCDYGMRFPGNPGEGYAVRCTKWLESPIVRTVAMIEPVASPNAFCRSELVYAGDPAATVRGVCYCLASESAEPTLAHSVTTDGSEEGEYISKLTGMQVGQTYAVRAYATNAAGTVYGESIEFTVPDPCGGITEVQDHESNTYHAIQIGSQCWTKENMRCATPRTVTALADTPTEPTYSPFIVSRTVDLFGWSSTEYYYNWAAAADYFPLINEPFSYTPAAAIQGICPNGWHLPSAEEWQTLIDYVNSNPDWTCEDSDDKNAKAFAATTGWRDYKAYDCHPGKEPESNNATGFSVLPAGWFNPFTLDFQHEGMQAYFWTATPTNETTARSRSLSFNHSAMGGESYFKTFAMSVRCLKN